MWKCCLLSNALRIFSLKPDLNDKNGTYDFQNFHAMTEFFFRPGSSCQVLVRNSISKNCTNEFNIYEFHIRKNLTTINSNLFKTIHKAHNFSHFGICRF